MCRTIPAKGGIDLLGVALSGGGYRASLFHLGVLARLADTGLLRQVEAFSTVSGGSIVGAFYYQMLCEELRKDRVLTDQDYRDLMQRVITAFVAAVQEDLRNRVLVAGVISSVIPPQITKPMMGFMHRIFPSLNTDVVFASKLEQGLRALMFHDTVLQDWHQPPVHPGNRKPELIMNTSILENGQTLYVSSNPESVLWARNAMNHGIQPDELQQLPIAKAVAASACVPGLFDPMDIRFGDHGVHGVDGGVLDNLGGHALELLRQSDMTMLLSDASMPMAVESYEEVDAVESFLRIQDLFMDVIRDLRMGEGKDVLIDMRSDLPGIDSTVRTLAMTMRTDLNSFSEVESYTLMYVGYRACEEQLRRNPVKTAVPTEAAAESAWPFMAIRDYAASPTPEYLTMLDRKRDKRLAIPKPSITQFISLAYLLLYAALFVYITMHHGVIEALWYAFCIPVLFVTCVGLLYLRRRLAKDRRRGTLAQLEQSSLRL